MSNLELQALVNCYKNNWWRVTSNAKERDARLEEQITVLNQDMKHENIGGGKKEHAETPEEYEAVKWREADLSDLRQYLLSKGDKVSDTKQVRYRSCSRC